MVHILISLKKIEFINFLPNMNDEDEKYFLEILCSKKKKRKTNPELYEDFEKAVVNDFLSFGELRKKKNIYIGLYQIK